MRYFIAYEFSNSKKDELRKQLTNISRLISKTGGESYIFFRDAQKWGEHDITKSQIIKCAFAEIYKSDILLVCINSDEISEGLSLEVGYAKALGKKIVLLVNNVFKREYLRSIADIVKEFDDILDLEEVVQSVLEPSML